MALSEAEKAESARQASRRYRAKNRDKVREAGRRYAAKHREKRLEYSRRYHAEHREEFLAKGRVWRTANLEKERERARLYTKTPSGKAAGARSDAKRRSRLRAADCTLTADEWRSILERNKGRCYWCKKKFKRLTMDHVIPLSKGGKHIKENLVPACPRCNGKKSNKIVTLL